MIYNTLIFVGFYRLLGDFCVVDHIELNPY